MERNCENDLQRMFEEIDTVSNEVLEKSKSIYNAHGLSFNLPTVKGTVPAFKAVVGDIHTKALGKYICRVLTVEPIYETRIVGRIRADIQICDKITIEVKSHGQFNLKDLKKRFERITRERPQMKHIYVAFKEREDYVKKTREALNPLGVESFFLSTYISESSPEKKYFPDNLRGLLETVKKALEG